MSRKNLLVGTIAGSLCIVGVVIVTWQLVNANDSNNPSSRLDDLFLSPEKLAEAMEDIERLKKKYPFVSIASRMQFPKTPTDVAMNPIAEADLRNIEQWLPEGMKNLRAESLRLMHEETVQDFANREGFGLYRIMPPNRHYIEPNERTPIRLASNSASACDESEFVTLDLNFDAASNPNMPTVLQARSFHRESVRDFGDSSDYGFVEGLDRVAGFRSHGFDSIPYQISRHSEKNPDTVEMDPPPRSTNNAEWTLNRLELVSLLKHAEPHVYDSDELPRMDALDNAPTRPLTEFEEQAHRKLKAGESLVARAAPTRIEMVGAIRAARQCIQCHEVQRGALLGAFTYVMTLSSGSNNE